MSVRKTNSQQPSGSDIGGGGGGGKQTNIADTRKDLAAAEHQRKIKEQAIAMDALLNNNQNNQNNNQSNVHTHTLTTMPMRPNMHNNPRKKTICLNMIVKNEAHVITETLENLYSFIKFDYYVVSDTGSTDATKELIAAFFNKHAVPGEIYDHEWRDFGHNRSLALTAAYNKADYSFIFDADDKLCGDFQLPQPLRADSYQLKFGNGFNYLRTLLVNSRQRWCFKGVLHEFITCNDETGKSELLKGDYYVESGRRGARNQVANKYLNDARILERGFDEEMARGDRGMASRYAFYCAQSYKDGGSAHADDSIRWYERVLTLDNWAQEKYYSCLMLAELYGGHPVAERKDANKSLKYLFLAGTHDPERMEGVATIMEHYRHEGFNELVNLLYHKYKNYNANQFDKLFVNQSKYECCIEYNNSVSAFYVGDQASGYDCCKKILTATQVPHGFYVSTINNIAFYKDVLKRDRHTMQMFANLDEYIWRTARNGGNNGHSSVSKEAAELWTTLFELNRSHLTRYTSYNFKNRRPKQRRVMITFTTCKRYDLFQQTINSIINQWRDVGDIDFWLCVDDNSSVEDRNRMRKNYGWIRYYMKTPEEKGHRESMNIIYRYLQRIKPVYWIHMEDDFLFHTRMDYVAPAIQYLERLKVSHGVRQVLFNRNYGETIEDYKIVGHNALDSETEERVKDVGGGRGVGIGAVIHEYKDAPGAGYPYSNCHYWPHYSFRPSLIDVSAVLDVGDYNTENQFFEMDYAHKWMRHGYSSAFFNRITNRHIGRLTSERHDKTKSNAYELNNEGQFQKNESKLVVDGTNGSSDALTQIEHDRGADNDTDDDESETEFQKRISIKVVNLERRDDRRAEVVSKFAAAGFTESEYAFVAATDGAKLVPTASMKRMFQGNDFGSRRGVVGCALSHYLLWNQLIRDADNEFYVIMEDDFELCPDFKRVLHGMHDECMNRDVMFMGYHMFEQKRAPVRHIYNRDPVPVPVPAPAPVPIPFAGTETETAGYGYDVAVEPLNKELYIGATHCYSINKRGAMLLLNYIKVNGIKHGIDYLMKIADNGLECYETRPHLAFAEWNEAGKAIDTDIQFDYNSIDFDAVEDEYTFFPGVDSADGDIQFVRGIGEKPIDEVMELANSVAGCIAFNTLGFFKHTVDVLRLAETPYINDSNKNKHGIYIKTRHAAFQRKYADSLAQAENRLVVANARRRTDKEGRKLRIGFHNMQLCDRGSTVAMYDYAHYNETLLGNTSYVIYDTTSPSNQAAVLEKCEQRFGADRVFGYSDLLDVEQFIQDAELDAIYIIKFGTADRYVFKGCPTLVHCVFKVDPHGYRYATVSNYLKAVHSPATLTDEQRDKVKVVPHMIDMPSMEELRAREGGIPDYRQKHGIPDAEHAFVIGRYGGFKQFNLPQVHEGIIRFLNEPQLPGTKPVYFLFANTRPFYSHDRIKHVDIIYDKHDKAAFILSCDAMIHGRSDGETFGLSLGEFAFYNKPIITTRTDEFNAHLDIMQNRAIHYKTDPVCVFNLLRNVEGAVQSFVKLHNGTINGYEEFTPANVMQQFKAVFLDAAEPPVEIVEFVPTSSPTTPKKQFKIKMMCNWCGGEQLCKDWSNMCERECVWKNIEITWLDGDDIDYYVIINHPLNKNTTDYYVPERTLIFQMEPTVHDSAKNWGTKTWGDWANPDPAVFYHVHNHARHLNNVQWLFKYPLSRLQDRTVFDTNDKLNRVSCVSSRKRFDQGHILRHDFLKYVEDHYLDDKPSTKNATDAIQSFINIFGSSNHFNYRSYIGKLPEDNIFYGIKPYKYYFMCENNAEHNYATEKIWEPILCETLCFYWGCPNLEDYIDSRAFVRLDMTDMDAAMRVVETAIREDWWTQRISFIRAAKHKILNELAFFPTLLSLIE